MFGCLFRLCSVGPFWVRCHLTISTTAALCDSRFCIVRGVLPDEDLAAWVAGFDDLFALVAGRFGRVEPPPGRDGLAGQCAYAAHRIHARVEDVIRTGKDTGLGHFPSHVLSCTAGGAAVSSPFRA
jgi:hypothetical protein